MNLLGILVQVNEPSGRFTVERTKRLQELPYRAVTGCLCCLRQLFVEKTAVQNSFCYRGELVMLLSSIL